MRTPSLEEEADEFLNIVTIVERFEGRVRISPVLQLLFAMRAAYWIRKNTWLHVAAEEQPFSHQLADSMMNLPFEAMYESYRRLLAASRSSDNVALASALREMRVIELCPSLVDQLERMERLADQAEPHVRLILHVELALFAIELGVEAAARRHSQEAWILNPLGWERYILCTLRGFFEACAGNIHAAVRWLEDSMSACFADEVILIECGVRPPNLLLAQKLLSLGQRISVIDYLLACKDVWRSKGMPFAEWIQQIESGQEPDLETSETIRQLSRPFHRLDLQSRRLYAQLSAPLAKDSPRAEKSRREVLIARDKRLADAKRRLDAMKQEKLSDSGQSGLEPQT
jgi:hypothetical protein